MSPRPSNILDLCMKANVMLTSPDGATEGHVDTIIGPLKAYHDTPSNKHASLCHPLATVLRVRSLLSDIFLNPPLVGFNTEDAELIGEGTFGKVYKADYQNEVVAVKVLRQEPATTSDHVRSFFQEVQLWKEVSKSSHIAPFFGCSVRVNGNPRIVFTLVSPLASGGSLRKYVIDENPHHLTCKHIIDIAKGLRDLHELGYIHGDLHLDNVLLFQVGEVQVAKLADFGLVKLANTVSAFSLAGERKRLHPGRVDPEVVKGKLPRSPQSDIFSYGRLVYELFDPGHLLFKQGLSIDDEVLKNDPSMPKRMTATSWNGLWDILLACWRRQPDVRPDADDIVSRLDNIFEKLGTSEENDPRPSHT